MLPYGKHSIDDDDIKAVIDVLRSDWVTTGPKVEGFESLFSDMVGSKNAVAVSSGTAALHSAMFSAGIGPGDEVILPPMTFLATANAVLFQGGTPIFADIDPHSLLVDPDSVKSKITSRTKAIVAVDYGGQPCDYDALKQVSRNYGLILIADACHALGAEFNNIKVGSLADLSVFSFHPVKHITTGEGGMVAADDSIMAEKMRRFRNHGISADLHQRKKEETWYYEMTDLGYNYRITDFQCALGMNQLGKMSKWLVRRRQIAAKYDAAFNSIPGIEPLKVQDNVKHAYHLYVIKIDSNQLNMSRDEAFTCLRNAGIGVNVHYMPVHLHPYYREHFKTGPGLCPVAERVYEEIISLPIFPTMTDSNMDDVIQAVINLGMKSKS